MEGCIFCRIASGEVNTELFFQNEDVIAFKDIQPKAEIHILVLPRQHVNTLVDIDTWPGLSEKMMAAVNEIARKTGLDRRGFKLLVNVGEGGGQVVPHLHFHMLGGKVSGLPV